MKLAFLGTPEVAVPPLRALVADGHDVRIVVTRADKRRGRGGALMPSPVKAAAQELGLRATDQAAEYVSSVVPTRRRADDVPWEAGQEPSGSTRPQRSRAWGSWRRLCRHRRRRRGACRGAARGQGGDGRGRMAERGTPEERRTTRGVKVDQARKLALDTLSRIERADAYANLQLPATLSRSRLDERDRAFVTELVYGTIRMRRACDWLVDRFVQRELDAPTRDVLRMGAYQLQLMGTPAYAVVSTSVELAGRASRLVEAVLRRVADSDPDWPDDA